MFTVLLDRLLSISSAINVSCVQNTIGKCQIALWTPRCGVDYIEKFLVVGSSVQISAQNCEVISGTVSRVLNLLSFLFRNSADNNQTFDSILTFFSKIFGHFYLEDFSHQGIKHGPVDEIFKKFEAQNILVQFLQSTPWLTNSFDGT